MANEDGSLWITYNGEIYNAAEIRSELEAKGHLFRSQTDTEVALHAYEEWGDGCLSRFNGMFALAIWDENRRQLFAARDRFGIKPFFYHFNNGQLVFASEIKSLLRCPIVPRRPHRQTAYNYLAAGALEGGAETFFDGILSLPASHAMTFSARGLKVWRYYEIDTKRTLSKAELSEAPERFRELFFDAIRLRFVSDVPVATSLSGGLDSTAVVSMAVDHLKASGGELPHHVFTASFRGSAADERPFVDQVSRELPLVRHDVFLEGNGLIEKIREQTIRQDQPVMGASMLAKGEVMRAVHDQGFKVVLEGQGADEYCCGYPSAAIPAIADQLRQGRLLSAATHLQAYCRVQETSLTGAVQAATDIAFPRTKAVASWVKRRIVANRAAQNGTSWMSIGARRTHDVTRLPNLDRNALNDYSLRSLFRRSLPFYLRADDHNSMASGVEARVPFLDHRLVEFVFSLPPEYRIRNGVSKWIVREALKGIIPEPIRRFPGKRAFPTPQSSWLRGSESASVRASLQRLTPFSRELIDPQAVHQLMDGFNSGKYNCDHEIWRIINYDIWLRVFGLDG